MTYQSNQGVSNYNAYRSKLLVRVVTVLAVAGLSTLIWTMAGNNHEWKEAKNKTTKSSDIGAKPRKIVQNVN